MVTQDKALPEGGLERHLERVTDATPPFAPIRAVFPCTGLVAQAARAALGGPREALLGTLMVVRLTVGLRGPHPLPIEVRRARASGAKGWLTALAVPTKLRAAFTKAFGATAEDDPAAMAEALEAVTDITAPHLDRVSRSELARLVTALRGDAAASPIPLAGVAARPVA